MILREWRGRTEQSRTAEYPKHFRETVVPELRRLDGFVSAQLAKREFDGRLEFVVLTRWQSMDSIKAFAGVDVGKAVVEPGAVAALTDFDTTVRHYEIIEDVA